MPKRKKVPTLKTLTLRKLAWPDAVHKYLEFNSNKFVPSFEGYLRSSLIKRYFESEKTKVRKKKKHNVNLEKEQLKIKQITQDVVNAWIKLSNIYQTRLNELDGLAMFMHMSTVGTLDFLHEGFKLRQEKNFREKILPFIGVIPHTIKPQQIDFRTWLDLVNTMVMEGLCDSLEHLYIPFSNERVLAEETQVPSEVKLSTIYRFEETMEYFINLKTIVVRGQMVKDNFMLAVGENCYFLEYLDVRGTGVSDRGVALLLFRKLGKRFFKGTFLTSHGRFPFYPTEILRPCCATLKYLDVSQTTGNVSITNSCDIFVTRACPDLRSTPLKFYFAIPGKSRIVLDRFFIPGEGLQLLRQDLVQYIRQCHCSQLYDFIHDLLLSVHLEEPGMEVVENDFGQETAFLFRSGASIMLHCGMKNLKVINLISYARNVLSCIPIDSIARFAPKLEKLKASITGTLSSETPLNSLKYLSSPMVKFTETLESVLEFCPELEYLEVKNLWMVDTKKDFGTREIERIFQRDPGHYRKLEVLRFLFPNQIQLIPSLTWIAVRCPVLRIVGDLKFWKIPFQTILKLFTNTSIYRYDFGIEYDGVIHFCHKNIKDDLVRFE